MNIFAAPFQRGKTIRHPDTRSNRLPHPFGEGILIDPPAVKTPRVIKLKKVEQAADAVPTIPLDVCRIRVTSGSGEGIWHRQSARGRWIHDDDFGSLDFSDTARFLAYEVADAWMIAGHVAILPCRHPVKPAPPAPIKPPTPKPAPTAAPFLDVESSRPSSIDCAWWLGFELAASGEEAAPSADWRSEVREAFTLGTVCGEREFDALMDEEAERYQDLDSSIWTSLVARD